MSAQNRTTTERGPIPLPAAFAVNTKGLPESVFRLRKRLYIKAKQEPPVAPDLVTRLEASVADVTGCVSQWGIGSRKVLSESASEM